MVRKREKAGPSVAMVLAQDVAHDKPILAPSGLNLSIGLRHRPGGTNDRVYARIAKLKDLDVNCAQFIGRAAFATGTSPQTTPLPSDQKIPSSFSPSACSQYRTELLLLKFAGLFTQEHLQGTAKTNVENWVRHEEKREKRKQKDLEMPSSCKDIRAALAECLQNSDCIMIERNKPSDCLRPPLVDTLPTQCQQLKKGYGECKRGMVDMRKRFRGNQPIAVSKEIEGGGAASSGGQLYAGKPAFESTAKETSGNEPIERDWREVENEKYRKG